MAGEPVDPPVGLESRLVVGVGWTWNGLGAGGQRVDLSGTLLTLDS